MKHENGAGQPLDEDLSKRFFREIAGPFAAISLICVFGAVCAAISALFLPREIAWIATLMAGLLPPLCLWALWSRLAPRVRALYANMTAPAGATQPETVFQPAVQPERTLALTDPLTGLGNRQRLFDKYQKLAGQDGAGFAIGLMNLDGMKPINDLFGFSGGNEILKQCALRLAAAVDGQGYVFRYEGDEFGFLFPSVATEEGVAEKGKLLQSVLLAPFDLDGSTVRLSGSFGFAVHPAGGSTIDEVMTNIETALYHSKRHGRGRVTIYSPELEAMVRENARIEQRLRSAIANNEVSPYFQPIISLQDGKLLAEHFALSGPHAIDLWYDRNRIWSKLKAISWEGSEVEYRQV